MQHDANEHEKNRAYDGDRRVLAVEVSSCALLNGGCDLTHTVVAGGLFVNPQRPDDTEKNADRRANQR
jgi:hypothetical protein